MLRAIRRNRSRVLVGMDYRLMDWTARLSPALAAWLAGRLRSARRSERAVPGRRWRPGRLAAILSPSLEQQAWPMFIPIGDEPNARTFPVVNYALIAINVAVFALISLPLMAQPVDPRDPMVQELLRELARQHPDLDPYTLVEQLRQLSAHDVFLMRWGYRAAEPSLVTLITSMFLHGGWLHIIGNMLFLWIYGDNVEHRLGHAGHLIAYLLCGAAATLGYAAVLPEGAGDTPLVGASGAISGVLGCYFVWFPRNRVRLLIALLPFYVDVWKVNARVVLGIYVVLDNLLPFLLAPSGAGGVAHGAHLGGFLAGVAGAVVIDRLSVHRGRDRGQAELGGEGYEQRPGSPADAHGVIALAARDPMAALQAYHALPAHERQRVSPDIVIELADWLAARGSTDAALGLYHQALGDHGQGRGRARAGDRTAARALLGLGLALLDRGEPARAYQYLTRVLAMDAEPEVADRAQQALAEIAGQQRLQVRSRRWPPR
jgi:membrane associated rhomboid family serine protease